jgi:hypothetical protein
MSNIHVPTGSYTIGRGAAEGTKNWCCEDKLGADCTLFLGWGDDGSRASKSPQVAAPVVALKMKIAEGQSERCYVCCPGLD